ncbi:MAG TPA: hypothetical protein VEI97_12070, partial [bacterium]|nr:hypothetical protein [bacterium]
MRTLTYAAAVAAGLWALGCGGTDPHPLAPAGPLGTASLGGVAAGPLGAQAALGLYDIHLDPQQATATVELVARREAQATDDVYLLSIGNFLRPTSLAVRSIATDGTNLFLNYTFTHPFAAPASLAGPATA